MTFGLWLSAKRCSASASVISRKSRRGVSRIVAMAGRYTTCARMGVGAETEAREQRSGEQREADGNDGLAPRDARRRHREEILHDDDVRVRDEERRQRQAPALAP